MRTYHLPRIHWQRQSQIGEQSYQSLLISLLRGMAALQVAAAHLRAEMFPGLRAVADPPLAYQGLAFVTGFAHQAVVVFFLISGWLVGGSLLNKMSQPQALSAYAVDRLTRLWTVLIPTFVLILAIGIGIDTLEPASADFSRANEFSGLTFLANLVGLQTVVVKNFGANYALWSLANETWYYVLFPLLLLVLSGRGMPRAVSAVAIALIAAWLPLAITLYFVVWLLGAVFSRIRIDCGNGVRIVLLVLSACASIYYRLRGSNADLVVESFFQDLVCCLPFLALLSTMHFNIDQQSPRLRPLGRIAHFFADFSFTLYVIHVPTIFLLRHLGMELFGRSRLSPSAPVDYLIYVGMLALILVVAYLSYLLFESHTFRIRRIVKRALLQRQPKRSGVAAVSTK